MRSCTTAATVLISNVEPHSTPPRGWGSAESARIMRSSTSLATPKWRNYYSSSTLALHYGFGKGGGIQRNMIICLWHYPLVYVRILNPNPKRVPELVWLGQEPATVAYCNMKQFDVIPAYFKSKSKLLNDTFKKTSGLLTRTVFYRSYTFVYVLNSNIPFLGFNFKPF